MVLQFPVLVCYSKSPVHLQSATILLQSLAIQLQSATYPTQYYKAANMSLYNLLPAKLKQSAQYYLAASPAACTIFHTVPLPVQALLSVCWQYKSCYCPASHSVQLSTSVLFTVQLSSWSTWTSHCCIFRATSIDLWVPTPPCGIEYLCTCFVSWHTPSNACEGVTSGTPASS